MTEIGSSLKSFADSLTEFYAYMDKSLDGFMRHAEYVTGEKPCCSKGCYHCCREPVYATRNQVRFILDSLDGTTKAALTLKVEAWLAKFLENKINNEERVSAHKYRALYLWCPLLREDGTCSVYDRRPMECRLFFAKGDPKGCEDDRLRRHQKFLGIPEKIIGNYILKESQATDHAQVEYDHLGILLAEELLGGTFNTKARVAFFIR